MEIMSQNLYPSLAYKYGSWGSFSEDFSNIFLGKTLSNFRERRKTREDLNLEK